MLTRTCHKLPTMQEVPALSHHMDSNRPAIIKSRAVSVPPGRQGPAGPPGNAGPHGPGFSDIRIVRNAVSRPDSTSIGLSLMCEPDEVALGGGGRVVGLPDAAIRESRPVVQNGIARGWIAAAQQSAEGMITIHVTAICAKQELPPAVPAAQEA